MSLHDHYKQQNDLKVEIDRNEEIEGMKYFLNKLK